MTIVQHLMALFVLLLSSTAHSPSATSGAAWHACLRHPFGVLGREGVVEAVESVVPGLQNRRLEALLVLASDVAAF